MDKIIEIKDLSFEYEAGLKTINHISFDINKGDYVSFVQKYDLIWIYPY